MPGSQAVQNCITKQYDPLLILLIHYYTFSEILSFTRILSSSDFFLRNVLWNAKTTKILLLHYIKGFCLFIIQTEEHIKGYFTNRNLVIFSPP